MINLRKLIFIILLIVTCPSFSAVDCVGKLTNPVTDVCWKCIFPISIAGVKVATSSMPDKSSAEFPVCFCNKPPLNVPMPGIPVGFWEPVRLVDVTKSPMCMVSLGGVSLGSGPQRGNKDDQQGDSFYHVHWYIYPVVYWLELLTDFACLEQASVDVAYLTEFDPLWNDDTKSAILNPEAILFGNIAAQGACVADCMKASVGLPLDEIFWSSGCQGSLYPFTGNNGSQNGGVQGSLLLVGRIIAKLHRELLLWATWGKPSLNNKCCKYPLPILQKSAYRLQMTYPLAETQSCKRIGQTETTWQAGKEFPIKGEDFAYLVWRKRECCLGAI